MRAMNLVQSTLEGYLRQGFTQAELASMLGVHAVTLNRVIRGHEKASDKLLKVLGIRVDVVYTYVESRIDPVKSPKKRVKSAKPRAKQLDLPAIDPKPVTLRNTAQTKPKLSAESVMIAIRYGLNPRNTWDSFLAGNEVSFGIDGLDQAFEAYCKAHGVKPQEPVKRDDRLYVGIGKGAAVEIKPQPERVDNRRPLMIGEVRPVVTAVQPEIPVPR